ncbi:hypothetical protein [Conyzicola sp.]|uniref:hypothetical protein n=1 Tax=Conyzicola sp. TaxID=1969404 RepID=UPI00398A45A8
MSRGVAYGTIVVAAVLAYSVAAFAGLWVAPRALWVSTPHAYALFQGGSLFGIQLFTVGWTLWSAGCVVVVLLRVMTSDAWRRVGRHRFVSLAGSVLMIVGLVGMRRGVHSSSTPMKPHGEVGGRVDAEGIVGQTCYF